MYWSLRYVVLSLIGVFLQSPSPVRSVSNAVMDISLLESTQNLEQPITEFSTPVDKALLEQEHLDTWRDLRTVEEVAKHHKAPHIYRKRVADLVEGWLEKPNFPKNEDGSSYRPMNLLTYTPRESLSFVLYHLQQVLKAHSNPDTHQDIDNMAAEIINTFNIDFKLGSRSAGETNLIPFLDTSMSQFGLFLLLQNFSKETTLDFKMGWNLSFDKKDQERKLISNTEQIEYAECYQEYMKLIEILDILAAGGLQNKSAISNLPPNYIRFRLPNSFLNKHSSKPQDLHYYLINESPYHPPRSLNPPIFGYPFEIDGHDPKEIENQVHKIWSKFEQADLEFALELRKPIEHFPKNKIIFPQEVINMEGFKELLEVTDNAEYEKMFRSFSRSINLVSKLEEERSEAQSILWKILRLTFKYLPKENLNPLKSEVLIENSVMFYLFIRRMSKVLEEVLKNFPPTIPKEKVSQAQCMMYYWSLVIFSKPNSTYRHDQKAKWMEFSLGRVYLNHLLSSRKLNNFHHQLVTACDKGRLEVPSVSPFISHSTVQRDTFLSVRQNTPEDDPKSIDKLKFIPARKGRKSVYNEIPKKDTIATKVLNNSSQEQHGSMHDDVAEPMYLNSIPKKPRTERIAYSSSDNDDVDIPKFLNTRESSIDQRQGMTHSELFMGMQKGIQDISPRIEDNSQDPETKASGTLASSETRSHEKGRTRTFDLNIAENVETTSSGNQAAPMLPDLNDSLYPDFM
ncbi:hypothetical protein DFH28DRAFT_975839 [Melampsora americana]|nr:hypothetical protein DFH28DRAFT_975839 [Melampsora americana]